jgi:ankyrin repeat protein
MATVQDMLEAVKSGNQAQVQTLVNDNPALVNAQDDSGVSAALLATYYGHADIANMLIERGATLNLFEAAATGQVELATKHLNADPTQVNAYSPDGHTPLGLAAYFGNPAVVDLLLAHGANPNAASRNDMRVTPLHSAVAHWQADTALTIVKSLLAHGADVNARQQGGYTPLQEAAANGYMEIARLLLEHGADPAAANDDGATALKLAQDKGHVEIAELLRAV